MAMNRIQFQPGLSLRELNKLYGTESQCEEALEKMRWPTGFRCPKCQNESHCIVWHGETKTFQCNRCHAQTTLTGGTIFHGTKLCLVIWFQAMYLMTQSKNIISAMELMRTLGVGYCAAWRVKHKLMQVMCEREEQTVLSGRIELDDAYLGGEENGGLVGRGSANKTPFVAAVETNEQGHPRRAVFTKVQSFSSAELAAWAIRHVSPHSVVVSDGLPCFRAVTSAGCNHQPQVVGKGRKSTGMGCFNWVNTILGNLKTAIAGTCHAFDFEKYADRYLAEVQYCFNRRFDMRSIFPRLLYAAAHTGKRPEAWLRMAELPI
jgi:hypothetical protein